MEGKEEFKARNLEEKEILSKNVAIVEKPTAKYRIIYGHHHTAQHPKELGQADGLVLELTEDYSTYENAEEQMSFAAEHVQYSKILGEAKRLKRPVFFADISGVNAKIELETKLKSLESVASVALLISLANDWMTREQGAPLSRREFLKKSAKGLMGLYFFCTSRNFLW